jgi:uncharacterized damage-inducible protein DinB
MRPLPERELLRRTLDFHREVLVSKVEGVDAAGLTFTPVSSGTSLGGLIRHLTTVEQYWFRHIFSGEVVPGPRADPWVHDEDLSGDRLIAAFNAECERSRDVERAAQSLDQLAALPVTWAANTQPSLRWIINHVIGEEARHNGHADLLRELVDGSVGV